MKSSEHVICPIEVAGGGGSYSARRARTAAEARRPSSAESAPGLCRATFRMGKDDPHMGMTPERGL